MAVTVSEENGSSKGWGRAGAGLYLCTVCSNALSADCSTYARIAHHSIRAVEIWNISTRLGKKLCRLPTGCTAVHYLSMNEAGSGI